MVVNKTFPRILRMPDKIGGSLPFLVTLFAGLSATGALAGGAAGVSKAVNDARSAREQLKENKRHNTTMESIALKVEVEDYISNLIRQGWDCI